MTTATLRTLHVRCPLPPTELSSNGSAGKWRQRAKAAGDYRSECGWCAFEAMGTRFGAPMERARISITYRYGPSGCGYLSRCGPGSYSPIDIGNAISAAKALVDGLVDAHALVDDDARHLEYGHCTILGIENKRQRGARGEVLIVLNERRALR